MVGKRLIKKWAPRIYWCAYSLSNSKELSRQIVIDVFVQFWHEGKFLTYESEIESKFKKIIITICSSDFYSLNKDSTPFEMKESVEELWRSYDGQFIQEVASEKAFSSIAKDLYYALFLYQSKCGNHNFTFINRRLQCYISSLVVLLIPFLFASLAFHIYDNDMVLRKNLFVIVDENEKVLHSFDHNLEVDKYESNIALTGSSIIDINDTSSVIALINQLMDNNSSQKNSSLKHSLLKDSSTSVQKIAVTQRPSVKP